MERGTSVEEVQRKGRRKTMGEGWRCKGKEKENDNPAV